MLNLGIAAETAGMFVPAEELRRSARERPRPIEMARWLRDIRVWIDMENYAEEMRRHRKWFKQIRNYEGRQLGFFLASTGQWRDIDPKPGDPLYVNNQYRFYVKSITKEWVRSNNEYMVRAIADDPTREGGARAARIYLQDVQRRIWTADMRQREGKFAVLLGNYFRYSRWNAAKGRQIPVPQFEEREINSGPQGYVCQGCGSADYIPPGALAAGEQMACPQCGSSEVAQLGGASSRVPIMSGIEMQPEGDIETEVVNPFEVKICLYAQDFRHSPYIRRRRLVLADVVEAAFPWVRFNYIDPTRDSGLRHQMELSLSPGNTTAGGAHLDYVSTSVDSTTRMVEFTQYWLDPILYATYMLPSEVELGSGQRLPAGFPLIELFPDGLYIGIVGDAVVDMRNENRFEHWCHGVYDLVPSRALGDGSEDGAELQRQLNETESLEFENIMNCDAPMTIVNPLKIPRSKVSGKPRDVVAMVNPSLADEPGNYIWQPPGRPLPAEVRIKIESLKRDMQAAFGAFNITAGIPDADVKTATGMSIVRDAAISLLAVPLELRAAVDVEWAQQVLRFTQRHWSGERFIPMLGQHGEPEGEWFRSADVEGDFEITVRPHSWIPRNELELRNDALEALVAGGMPGGIFNPAFPPEARAMVAERLNVPFSVDQQSQDMRKQRLEIDRIRQAVEMAMAQVGDPAAVVALTLQMIPVEPWVDDHQIHIKCIQSYLKTDKGWNLDPVTKEALLQHLQGHVMAQAEVSAQMQMAGLMANPMQMAQMVGGAAPEQQAARGQTPNGPDKPAGAKPSDGKEKKDVSRDK